MASNNAGKTFAQAPGNHLQDQPFPYGVCGHQIQQRLGQNEIAVHCGGRRRETD